MRGNNDQSYVAIDQFEFLQSDTCDFEPKEAWPTEETTTTTSTTTPKPEHWLECTFQNGRLEYAYNNHVDQDISHFKKVYVDGN